MHNIKIASLALAVNVVSANPTFGWNDWTKWLNNKGKDDEDCETTTKKTSTAKATMSSTCKPTTVSFTTTCTETKLVTRPAGTVTTTCTETKFVTKPAAYQTVTVTQTKAGERVTITDMRTITDFKTVTDLKTVTLDPPTTRGNAVVPPVTVTNTVTVNQTISQPITVIRTVNQTVTQPAVTFTQPPVTVIQTVSESRPADPVTTPMTTPRSSTAAADTTTTPVRSSTTSAKIPCVTIPSNGTFCNPKNPCAPQPQGSGPVPSPDTADAFRSYPEFSELALNTPETLFSRSDIGTKYVQVFADLKASVSTKNYLGVQTLTSYDVAGCAAMCDKTDTCLGFNIFAERDPSLNPTTWGFDAPASWGEDCPNPASTTNFQCTLWGCTFDASVATNKGGWREQFELAVAGSVAYNLK